MTFARVALATAVALASACRSSSDGPVPPGPVTDFRVQSGGDFDLLVLSWSLPVGAEGAAVEVEQRVGDGPFEPLFAAQPGSLPPRWVGLDPTLAELTELTFRIRWVDGRTSSEWVEATWSRTIRPPRAIAAVVTLAGDIAVSWQNASAVADALSVERGEVALADGAAHAWTAIATTSGTTAILDGSILERVRYRYRVRSGKGAVWSEPAETDATSMLLAPVDLAAEIVDGGVRLTWTNRSRVATGVSIARYPLEPYAYVELPPESETFLHATDAPWPVGRYLVRPVDADHPGAWATGGWAMVPAFTVAGGATLEARAAALPPFGGTAVRDGAGAFTIAGWDAEAGASVVAREADAFTGRPYARFSPVPPAVALDGSGGPHALSYGQVGTEMVYTHEWHDGTGWRSEDLANVPSGGRLAFAPVPAGGIEVVATSYSHVEQRTVATTGVRDGDAWTWSAVPIPAGQQVSGAPRLGFGPDGAAHLVTDPVGAYAGGYGILSRPAGGAWASEAIPDTADSHVTAMAPWTGGVSLVLYRIDVGAGKVAYRYLSRAGGAWGQPEPVFEDDAAAGNVIAARLAVSPDGTRAAVVATVGATHELALFTRGDAGWSRTTLASGAADAAVGFLDDGRVWVVARPDEATTFDPQWALWQEPPPP